MTSKLKPTKDRILIVLDKEAEKTRSGIILAPTHNKEGGLLQRGIIEAVCDDCEEPLLKKGVKCWFNPYDAFEIKNELGEVVYVGCKVVGVFAVEA